MQSFPSWIVLYAGSYLLFFCLLLIGSNRRFNRLFDSNGFTERPGMLLLLHVAGILLFGVLPMLIHDGWPVLFPGTSGTPLWPAGTSLLVVAFFLVLSPRLARKDALTLPAGTYIALKPPGWWYLGAYFLARALFITSYELWFRGFLLQLGVAHLGMVAAIVLNVALYTLLHVVNGKKEMMGCIPFGLTLCCLCLWQGSVWPAVAIHLALTLGYEMTMVGVLAVRRFAGN
jgi:membrane protease YdiL (CAAX protease family)